MRNKCDEKKYETVAKHEGCVWWGGGVRVEVGLGPGSPLSPLPARKPSRKQQLIEGCLGSESNPSSDLVQGGVERVTEVSNRHKGNFSFVYEQPGASERGE